ncbi:MAG TPA: threonine/serine dehydratase [Thermomicrobiaceae bacterium]|nr:threonine/serine dehydratase [Thermomicrobiaceae bacterium]
MVCREEVEAAARRISGYVRETPIIRLRGEELGLHGWLVLKLEQLQHTGSFKVRGAFNAILSQPIPAAGVIAASGGNHGAGVAYAARRLNVPAEIFVPESSPAVKVARLRGYGATVRQIGANFAEAQAACRERAAETGALNIHAYDQAEVLAGQGTLARELEAQAPELDTVLVAVGGGGLIGGIASWYDGRTRIVGVEPEAASTLWSAVQAGQPVDVEVGGIAADALGARRAGQLGFAVAQRHVDDVVLVPDEAILRAQQALWDELRLIAEPGGATALAALLAGAYTPRPDERVGVIICGGNTEPGKLA